MICLIDLEETLYTRAGALPGAVTALDELRASGCKLLFLTNTDAASSQQIHARVCAHGFAVRREEVFTPVDAAIAYLQRIPEARIFACTTPEVQAQLAAAVKLVGADADPTHTLLGDLGAGLTYDQLNSAFQSVYYGAQLLALQRGRFYYSQGRAQLDTGGLVAAIEYAADCTAVVLGKPSLDCYRSALAAAGADPRDKVVVIGDDRETDIRMGREAGATTILVRTGKFLSQLSDDSLPLADFVVDSFADLPELLAEL